MTNMISRVKKKLKKKIRTRLMGNIPIYPPIHRNLHILMQQYLINCGWVNSVQKEMSIDKEDNPIPWFTYSSISFLEPRLKKAFDVFEYGSGNSTLWFAQRVGRITSVEHDSEWFDKMKPLFDSIKNINYHHRPIENKQYGSFVAEFNNKFDIVIIDGQDRVTCAKNVIGALKKDGVIIWDNSDRTEYQEGYDFLNKNGYKRIDFVGLGPINHYPTSTSIFYQSNNILNI